MAKIKNIQDLMKMKEQAKDKLQIRKTAGDKDKVVLKVAMGTCGIAAGAKETFSALIDAIDKHDLDHIVVTQTGCMGYCHAEPTVEVNEPNKKPILYGHIDAEKAERLIIKHFIQNKLLQDSIIGETHKRAE